MALKLNLAWDRDQWFFFVVKGTAADATDAYCATLWWRWLVFSFFLVIEHRWNEIYRGKPKYPSKNLAQCHFVYHKSHVDWPRDRNRTSTVRGQRLTAWAMARPGPTADCYEHGNELQSCMEVTWFYGPIELWEMCSIMLSMLHDNLAGQYVHDIKWYVSKSDLQRL
jgi:hypothetical protein